MNLATCDDVTAIEFEDIRKEPNNRVYSVRFRQPIAIQTKRASTLRSDLLNETGETMPFAYFTLDAESEALLRSFETWVVAAAKENKSTWFKKDIDDAYLDTSFKSYFKSAGHFVVRIAEDVAAFTPKGEPLPLSEVAPEATAVLLLEASQITFGRTEFGCLWKLKQMMVFPPKPDAAKKGCMIRWVDEDEEATKVEADDGDGDYFL